MNYTEGTLWNKLTQPDAAKICQNMYSSNVNSDLVNSYAWDTAIVFMQEMEDNDYSIKRDGNGPLRNTGATGDKVCNIFDMSGNLREWTTEFSSDTINSCVIRGGVCFNRSYYTTIRMSSDATVYYPDVGFRCLLYV